MTGRRDLCTQPHERPNVHVVFERDPEILRTCLMCPCRAFDDFFFPIIFAGYVGSLKTQISLDNTKTHLSG